MLTGGCTLIALLAAFTGANAQQPAPKVAVSRTPAGRPAGSPVTRDPFRAPASKAPGGVVETAPPVDAVLTAVVAAGDRSVAVFRTPGNELVVLGIGERLGVWQLHSVSDDGARLVTTGRTRSFVETVPLTPAAANGAVRGAGRLAPPSAALPAGDIPLLPPTSQSSESSGYSPFPAAASRVPSRSAVSTPLDRR